MPFFVSKAANEQIKKEKTLKEKRQPGAFCQALMKLFILETTVQTVCVSSLRVKNADSYFASSQSHYCHQDAKSSNSCSRNRPVTKSQILESLKQTNESVYSCCRAAVATFAQHKLQFPSAYFNLMVQPTLMLSFGRVQPGSRLLSCLPCYQSSEPVPPQIKPRSSLSSAYDGEAGLQRESV